MWRASTEPDFNLNPTIMDNSQNNGTQQALPWANQATKYQNNQLADYLTHAVVNPSLTHRDKQTVYDTMMLNRAVTAANDK